MNELSTIMFDIYFNISTVNKRKISFVKHTHQYNRLEYNCLQKSLQFSDAFITKLATFFYKDFIRKKIDFEYIRNVIKAIFEIKHKNYWQYFTEPTVLISKDNIRDYYSCYNIEFKFKTEYDKAAYDFLFNFIPDGNKNFGKGEFLRCYAGHLPPNLIGYGDCMIRTNAVAELKNASIGSNGSLIINRSNYFTNEGKTNIELIALYQSKLLQIINNMNFSAECKIKIENKLRRNSTYI